ncbi:MAG: rhomboid family intramembrane serine protease [Bacteroidetes bacterium]|nr:rhomboid family intramembrane serine protease [Bacteroidota bacterium]
MIQHTFQPHSDKAVLSACLHVLSNHGWLLGDISASEFMVGSVENDELRYTCTVSVDNGIATFTVSEESYDIDDPLITEMETFLSELEDAGLEKTYDEVMEEHQNSLTPDNSPSFDFNPLKTHVVTSTIIVLNIIVFILMVVNGVHIMEPSADDLVSWGANYGPLVVEGDYWRLLTCCFVHIGIVHLLFNMYALFYIGLILEEIIGSARFAVAYLVTGIGASAVSFAMHNNLVSAGASGAIFGMYGLFLALLLFKSLSTQMVKAFLTSILVFVGYNLVYGLKDGVDNAAHIGGLVTGFVLGLAWIGRSYEAFRGKPRAALFSAIAVVILASSFIVVSNGEAEVDEFAVAVEEFAELETDAMYLYHMTDQVREDSLKTFIESTGIPKWVEAKKVLESVDTTELNPQQLQLRSKLIEYVSLRERSYRILSKNANNPLWEYSPSYREFEDVMKQIETILEELNA